MKAVKSFVFFDAATSPATSENYYANIKADVMAIEISGSFTSGTFAFEGQSDINSNTWTPIAGINLSDFSVTSSPTKAGIYEVGIEGLQRFRVRIEALGGGAARIVGRVIDSVGG